MIRARIVISGHQTHFEYEAEIIAYQQAITAYPGGENGDTKTVQVPGIVVRLDDGEIKVQCLQLYLHEVKVYELSSEPQPKFSSKLFTDNAEKMSKEPFIQFPKNINMASACNFDLAIINAVLPEYQCHKKVRAARILDVMQEPNIQKNEMLYSLKLDHPTTTIISIAKAWFEKNHPEKGGFFVVYEDGYASYSPAKAFEEGYTLIQQ